MVSLLGNGLRKLVAPEACILFINGLQLEKPFREFRTTILAGKVRAGLVSSVLELDGAGQSFMTCGAPAVAKDPEHLSHRRLLRGTLLVILAAQVHLIDDQRRSFFFEEIFDAFDTSF